MGYKETKVISPIFTLRCCSMEIISRAQHIFIYNIYIHNSTLTGWKRITTDITEARYDANYHTAQNVLIPVLYME